MSKVPCLLRTTASSTRRFGANEKRKVDNTFTTSCFVNERAGDKWIASNALDFTLIRLIASKEQWFAGGRSTMALLLKSDLIKAISSKWIGASMLN